MQQTVASGGTVKKLAATGIQPRAPGGT